MKGNQWQFGIYAHIDFDAESGLIRTVIIRAANYNDATQSDDLLHGKESIVFAGAGYHGAIKRPEAASVDCYVAVLPDKRHKLNKNLQEISEKATLTSLYELFSENSCASVRSADNP